MSEDQDALPAFPQKEPLASDCHGMTLRDYFAAAVVSGTVSHPHSNTDAVAHAMLAYEIADAMLAVRDK